MEHLWMEAQASFHVMVPWENLMLSSVRYHFTVNISFMNAISERVLWIDVTENQNEKQNIDQEICLIFCREERTGHSGPLSSEKFWLSYNFLMFTKDILLSFYLAQIFSMSWFGYHETKTNWAKVVRNTKCK